MATYIDQSTKHGELPEHIVERTITDEWKGGFSIEPNLQLGTEILRVNYHRYTKHGGLSVQRTIEGDFENWNWLEVKKLIDVLSQFCKDDIDKLERNNG